MWREVNIIYYSEHTTLTADVGAVTFRRTLDGTEHEALSPINR
jgi:hypothetical protein